MMSSRTARNKGNNSFVAETEDRRNNNNEGMMVEVVEHCDDNNNNNEAEAATATETAMMMMIERKHYLSTVALCLCNFTHSWLLVSVFPYSAFMVIFLVPGTNEENAGSYAGLLAASFMIGRALTSYGWGKISDIYGRKVVFYVSLVLSMVASIMFGMATTFVSAMVWRFLLGASNGIAGISKAVVTETAHGNEKLETRGMSVAMGMWAWGFLLSPALSGFLSDPVRRYPNIWENGGSSLYYNYCYKVLLKHPFLLPNLVSVLLCIIDFVAVLWLVPETLPNPRSPKHMLSDLRRSMYCCWRDPKIDNDKGENNNNNNNCNNSNTDNTNNNTDVEATTTIPQDDDPYSDSETESLLSAAAIEMMPRCKVGCSVDSCPTNSTTTTTTTQKATLASLWSQKDTRNHLLVFWLFSFVGIAIDEAFPLFCISKEGGLGLDESQIGRLLSATGVFFAISQYKVYDWVVDKYGIHKSIRVGALLSAPLVALVPLSLLWNENSTATDTADAAANADAANATDADDNSSQQQHELSWASFLYLSVLLGFIRIFGLVFFSNITIATNRTVQPSHRGTMNGLSMLGGSISKGLGPIAAGLLCSWAMSSRVVPPKVGAVLVFFVIGAFSAAIVWITICLLGEEEEESKPKDRSSTTTTTTVVESLSTNFGGDDDDESDATEVMQQPLFIRDATNHIFHRSVPTERI